MNYVRYRFKWNKCTIRLKLQLSLPIDHPVDTKQASVGGSTSDIARTGSSTRGQRERVNSIKDTGLARTGIGLCYCMKTPEHGPCLAETVKNRSRVRFPGIVWECLAGTGS